MRMLWISMMLLGLATVQAGTLSQANAVRAGYEKSLEAWTIKMQLAKGEAARREVMAARPMPDVAAKRMWSVISPQLNEEWTIEPAAWFLRIASPLVEVGEDGLRTPAMRPQIAQVQKTVEKYHLQSRQLAPMCMALVACGDNTSLNLLRKIESQNPDKKVAGVAALGLAMMAKDINDEPRIMRERLSMLRKAIIDAADVEIEGVTVAELAEEELYIIRNLSKGRPAPELSGRDSGGRAMSLSSFEGKVVILLFWNSGGEGPDAVINWANALRADERFAGKEFEVVGVNSDPLPVLRKLQAEGKVDWPNFSDPNNELGKVYRVGAWPLTYVLGADRKIHYIGTTGTFAELTAAAVLDES
ncbi:peroxiredoxin family protein [Haloferula rosea]|nr:redoxin domain-containing protein [Haloferula rosea]